MVSSFLTCGGCRTLPHLRVINDLNHCCRTQYNIAPILQQGLCTCGACKGSWCSRDGLGSICSALRRRSFTSRSFVTPRRAEKTSGARVEITENDEIGVTKMSGSHEMTRVSGLYASDPAHPPRISKVVAPQLRPSSKTVGLAEVVKSQFVGACCAVRR